MKASSLWNLQFLFLVTIRTASSPEEGFICIYPELRFSLWVEACLYMLDLVLFALFLLGIAKHFWSTGGTLSFPTLTIFFSFSPPPSSPFLVSPLIALGISWIVLHALPPLDYWLAFWKIKILITTLQKNLISVVFSKHLKESVSYISLYQLWLILFWYVHCIC